MKYLNAYLESHPEKIQVSPGDGTYRTYETPLEGGVLPEEISANLSPDQPTKPTKPPGPGSWEILRHQRWGPGIADSEPGLDVQPPPSSPSGP